MTVWRPDIDGLRGVAILLVVAFHTAPGIFGSGFIGVDIFFVISGYVITKSVYESVVCRDFSWWNFFIRRMRRLLPALIFTISLIMLLAVLLLFGAEVAELGEDGLFSIFFLQNFHLMNGSEYFDANWYTNPFQHLWSLAVEEQFYILFACLAATSVLCNRPLLIFSALICAVGFVSLSVLVAYELQGIPTNYYDPSLRLWEIVAGSATFLLSRQQPGDECCKLGRELQFYSGLMLICLGLAFTTKGVVPGLVLLLPILGTALILLSNNSTTGKVLLSNPAIRLVGSISYPWYLLHWPFLSYYRVVYGVNPEPTSKVLLVSFSFFLALAVTHYVERRRVFR